MSIKFREINLSIEYNLINVSKEISSFMFVYFTLNMKPSGFSEKSVLVHQITGVLSRKIEIFVKGQC